MALVSPGIQISVNDQSQYVNSNVGSVPLVLLATAQDKTYNNAAATGTTKANAGKLLSFTSQRDLVTVLGTPSFQVSAAGTPINGDERNEYGLLTAYSALGLGNQLYAIRADIDLAQLKGTSTRPVGNVVDGTLWLDIANTEFGIYSLNATTSSFEHVTPTFITDINKAEVDTEFTLDVVHKPLNSVGKPGDYALVAINDVLTPLNQIHLYFKASATSVGNIANTWVQVGSPAWQNSIVSGKGSIAPNVNGAPALTVTGGSAELGINGQTVTFTVGGGIGSDASAGSLVAQINAANIPGVTAANIEGKLNFFVTSAAKSNGTVVDGKLLLTETDATNTPLALSGFTLSGSEVSFFCPTLFYGNYAQVPTDKNGNIMGWFSSDLQPRPTGSIWWKTTSTGGGYSPVLKSYSASLDTWKAINAPMFRYYNEAIFGLDFVGGGQNIAHGQVITTFSPPDGSYNALAYARQIDPVHGNTYATATGDLLSNSQTITGVIRMLTTVPNSAVTKTTTLSFSGATPQEFVDAILLADIPYVTAEFSNNKISLIHLTGGQIGIFLDATNPIGATPTFDAGFVQDLSSPKPYQRDNYTVGSNGSVSIGNFYRITDLISYQTGTPYSNPADGTLWYYSNPADVDIMVNDGGWKGYKRTASDVRGYNLQQTDPNGVIVSASKPTSQSTGSILKAGDLWLDTSDLVNYPKLSRYTGSAWVAIDNTDHVTSNGIIFADARWDGYADDTGGTADPITDALPVISDGAAEGLLFSNYIDLDAPDYRLYPRGTLLFNTRRSGYNIKKFVSNKFNATSYPNETLPSATDAWVSESGLDENGALKAGTKAQRSVVVAALKAAVDSNIDVREETYRFNLLCAPGYPELIPNLVALNDNRADTGFVIGDTPMTLQPTATALNAWNTNANGDGLATASPYLGVYYPAGLTNDLSGNSVAVPASHAVLRTFLYNDNVSYPWFAPAGVHRGLVNNLSDIGYVDASSGKFVHNGINQGLRDSLYSMSINPITQLPGTGLVVWGQETRSGSSTSRNRVNVVRLENYLRTIFKSIANGFLFEPNDAITRKTIASQVESALHDVLSKRGVYDFLVICDTNNNTPSTIANNQLYVDVAIEPMKDVEFIYIPIALYNPGTIANLGATST